MILLLGGHGMLGQSFFSEITRAGGVSMVPNRNDLDVTNELAVRKFITTIKPKLIINCAVMRSVDGCETDPAQAYKVNCDSVQYVVNAVQSIKYNPPKIVHISTDYVFSGDKEGSYSEEDFASPIQIYGQSKLKAEFPVLNTGGYVYRVQWLFGPTKENFIDWTVKSLLGDKEISISTIQKGSPCSTDFVASVILLGALRSQPGLYHVAHNNYCTRYECAEYIASAMKTSHRFKKIDHCNFGPAPRPVNTSLNADKLKNAIQAESMGTWQSDVGSYLSARYAEYL